MPKNINSITIIITLKSIEQIKTEKKNDNKTVWRIFFTKLNNIIVIMIHLYSAFTINIRWRYLQPKRKIKLYLKLYYNKVKLSET